MNAELTRLANGKYGLPVVRELGREPVTDQHGNQHPRNIWDIWTDKQLDEIGHARIYETDIPEGKQSSGYSDSFSSNKINRTHTLDDVPPPPPEDLDATYDSVMSSRLNRIFRAYVAAVNSGTITPGANHTAAQLKSKIKAKMKAT